MIISEAFIKRANEPESYFKNSDAESNYLITIKNKLKPETEILETIKKDNNSFKNILLYVEEDNFISKPEPVKCKLLKDLFDYFQKEYENFNTNGKTTINNILKRYFSVFNKLWKNGIVEKIKSNDKSFSESEKLSINCLCICINLTGLLFYKFKNGNGFCVSIKEIIIDYLKEFYLHIQTNFIARRLSEVLLYCLCNFCGGNILPGNHQLLKILEFCFVEQKSLKQIKICSGVILSFLISPANEMRQDILNYLEQLPLSNSKDGTFLGINEELIKKACTILQNEI